MIAFIDDHRGAYGAVLREPQDEADLPRPADRPVDVSRPCRAPGRSRRDAVLMTEIRRVSEANFCVYGVRKIWQ